MSYQILPRNLEAEIVSRFTYEPVVVLQGPRSVGKSTLLARIASTHNATVIDLDDLALRNAVHSDPSRFVKSERPVFIDEFQHVPLILDAIKAELNKNLSPTRFMITGSTRYSSLPIAAQKTLV